MHLSKAIRIKRCGVFMGMLCLNMLYVVIVYGNCKLVVDWTVCWGILGRFGLGWSIMWFYGMYVCFLSLPFSLMLLCLSLNPSVCSGLYLRGALISNHPQLKNKHFLYFTSEDIGTPPSKLQQCTTQHAHSANSNFLKSTPVKELWNIAFLYILL